MELIRQDGVLKVVEGDVVMYLPQDSADADQYIITYLPAIKLTVDSAIVDFIPA